MQPLKQFSFDNAILTATTTQAEDRYSADAGPHKIQIKIDLEECEATYTMGYSSQAIRDTDFESIDEPKARHLYDVLKKNFAAL